MNCAICDVRKPRRYCPGVSGEICTVCCGTGREETVDCPLECEYLRAAHLHEGSPELDTARIPNHDIEVTEEFLQQHEWLLMLLGSAVVEKAPAPPCTDFDVREALESLTKAWRSLQSGVVYETLPLNPYAAAIHESVQGRIADIKKRVAESEGTPVLPDNAVLVVLVFLQRLEYMNNNGRKRSRAFLDFLSRFYAAQPGPEREQPESNEPLVVL